MISSRLFPVSLLRLASAVAAVATAAALGIGLSPRVAQAQTFSDPILFNYNGTDDSPGTDQSYLVPVGVTQLQVQLFGAGGAGYNDNLGGGGGYTSGLLSVTAGQTLTLIVGAGGEPRMYGFDGYGGGGGGGLGGGGRSAIRFGDVEVVTAGGGGGSGNGGDGGVGGGDNGGDGTGFSDTVGQGGTQTAGGASSIPLSFSMGTAFQGGRAIDGGGGGGGYYGGGAGDGEGGGGGGSSYLSNTLVTGGLTLSGVGTASGGTGSADYRPGVGVGFSGGGVIGGNGGNGLIVLRTVTPAATAAPEPGSLSLLLPVMGCVGVVIRKRRK